jgi:hypothetical protein
MRPARIAEVVRRRRATVALAVAAALVATATAIGATGALPPPQVLNYQLYVGGKGKAKANLAPVTLGFINVQGGPPNLNFPQAKSVIEAGVKMVNAELGGVHGHPLELNECLIAQAEEEGVRCGQQMVNDKATKAILFGFVTIGNQSIYATVKGTKPIIGLVTANAADPIAKNTYFLNGSQTSVLGPFGTYTKQRLPKVKTVAIVYPTDPGAITAAQALQKAMRQIGRKVTMIGVPPLATDDHRSPWLHHVRAVREGPRPDQLLEARALDADLHVHSPRCVRERRHPEVDLWHRPDAREPAGATVEALPQEGPPVRDHGAEHALGLLGSRLGGAACDREDHERGPVRETQPGDDQRRVQGFPGPDHPRAAGYRLRQGVAWRAGRVRQSDAVLQLRRQGQVEDPYGLGEAARSEVRRTRRKHGGPGNSRARLVSR